MRRVREKRVQSSAFDSIELTPNQTQTKSGVLAKSSFQDPRHQSVVLQTACVRSSLARSAVVVLPRRHQETLEKIHIFG